MGIRMRCLRSPRSDCAERLITILFLETATVLGFLYSKLLFRVGKSGKRHVFGQNEENVCRLHESAENVEPGLVAVATFLQRGATSVVLIRSLVQCNSCTV